MEIIILLLDHCADGVGTSGTICREVSAVRWKDVGLDTDGIAVDMRIQLDNLVGERQESFWLQLMGHHPTVDMGGGLNGGQMATDVLHRGTEHTVGMAYGL